MIVMMIFTCDYINNMITHYVTHYNYDTDSGTHDALSNFVRSRHHSTHAHRTLTRREHETKRANEAFWERQHFKNKKSPPGC